MQQAPRLRTLLVIPPAVRRTPMPQPPARPNSTISLRKLFFKDNSRFLANFSRCSTSLRRCVQNSASEVSTPAAHIKIIAARRAHHPKPPSGRLWRDLMIAHSSGASTPTSAPYQRQRRKRYKQSPEPTTLPTALYSRVCATEFVRSIARQGILRP